MAISWGFSRDSQNSGGYNDYTPGHGIVFNSDDPYLNQQVAQAQQAHVPYSIWIPANTNESAQDWAAKTKYLQNIYHPTYVVPDIEFQGYSNGGDAGVAQWAQEYSAALRSQGVDPSTLAITTMPNKANFVSAFPGAQFWPQTYGANPKTDLYDPTSVVQALTKAGVDPAKVFPVLAPGQTYQGTYGQYTLDDLTPEQRAAFMHSVPAPVAHKTAAAAPSAQPQSTPVNTPVNTGIAKDWGVTPVTPDAKNPRAVAYARQQLARMKKQGYTPAQFGLQGQDPTAQWRGMSSITGARQAIKAGQGQNYQVNSNVPSKVASMVTDMIHRSVTGQPTPKASGPYNALKSIVSNFTASHPVFSAPKNLPAATPAQIAAMHTTQQMVNNVRRPQ